MGQDWEIIIPHDRTIYQSFSKLGEYLFDGSAGYIAEQLAVPDTDWIDNSSSYNTRSARVPFKSLPIEIHRLIFSFLGDYADIFCLSLVDLYFWRIGRQELKQEILFGLCPLADKVLICVGSDTSAEPLDIPAGLLTTDEVEELQGGLDSVDDEDVSSRSNGPVNLYELAYERYDARSEALGATLFWPNIKFHIRVVGRDITHLSTLAKEILKAFPEPERSQVLALASPKREHFFPNSKKWVLRNLTTREFVTADAIALKPDCIKGPRIMGLGFGEAVLSRICWSSTPDYSLACELPLHRGAWAGHRLDIVTTEKLQMENGEEGPMNGRILARRLRKSWKLFGNPSLGRIGLAKCLIKMAP